jgi:hypothetical protein
VSRAGRRSATNHRNYAHAAADGGCGSRVTLLPDSRAQRRVGYHEQRHSQPDTALAAKVLLWPSSRSPNLIRPGIVAAGSGYIAALERMDEGAVCWRHNSMGDDRLGSEGGSHRMTPPRDPGANERGRAERLPIGSITSSAE